MEDVLVARRNHTAEYFGELIREHESLLESIQHFLRCNNRLVYFFCSVNGNKSKCLLPCWFITAVQDTSQLIMFHFSKWIIFTCAAVVGESVMCLQMFLIRCEAATLSTYQPPYLFTFYWYMWRLYIF